MGWSARDQYGRPFAIAHSTSLFTLLRSTSDWEAFPAFIAAGEGLLTGRWQAR